MSNSGGFAPFHLSFSEFLRKGDPITGASGELGHNRLLRSLSVNYLADSEWMEATDYAVRHIAAHGIGANADASRQLDALINDPSYLLERIFRLGVSALGEDERLARQCGADTDSLHSLAIELAVHTIADSRSRSSLAQELAILASAVRADSLAKGFAELVTNQVRLVPLWTVGRDTVRFADAALRAAAEVASATLLCDKLTLVLANKGIEIWDLSRRQRLHSIVPKGRSEYATSEPSGAGLWYAAVDFEADTNQVMRLTVPSGYVSRDVRLEFAVSCLTVDENGVFVAIGTQGGRVQLIETSSGQVVGHRDLGSSVSRLRIQGQRIFALTRSRKVVCWEIPSLARVGMAVVPRFTEKPSFADRTDGLAVSLDGRRAWIGGNDGYVTEASLDDAISTDNRKIAQLGGWADHLSLVDDDHLAAADSTGRLHFIDVKGSRPLASLRCHSDPLLLAEYCKPLDLTVTVSGDGEITLWRTPSTSLDVSVSHETEVRQVVFSRVTSRLFSIGSDGSLHEWDDCGLLVQRAYLQPDLSESMKLADDANTLVVLKGEIRKLMLSDLDTEALRSEPWPIEIMDKCRSLWTGQRPSVAISQDGSLAVRCTPEDIELWSVESEHVLLSLGAESHPGSDPISQDGSWLITRTAAGRLLIRPIDQLDTAIDLDSEGLVAGPFWSDHGLLIISTISGVLQCHSIEDGSLRKIWTANKPLATYGVACPDGSLCAVFDSVGCVSILRTSDGVPIGGFCGRVALTCAAFNAAGDRLAVGDASGGVQLLGVALGKENYGV